MRTDKSLATVCDRARSTSAYLMGEISSMNKITVVGARRAACGWVKGLEGLSNESVEFTSKVCAAAAPLLVATLAQRLLPSTSTIQPGCDYHCLYICENDQQTRDPQRTFCNTNCVGNSSSHGDLEQNGTTNLPLSGVSSPKASHPTSNTTSSRTVASRRNCKRTCRRYRRIQQT